MEWEIIYYCFLEHLPFKPRDNPPKANKLMTVEGSGTEGTSCCPTTRTSGSPGHTMLKNSFKSVKAR